MNGYKIANDELTPIGEIVDQLQEMRPLPLGRQEFEDWFNRIWSGALVKGEPGKEEELMLSARNVLANEVHHLPAGQTHQTDIYFINRLRKVAANQVCLDVINETKQALIARMEARKKAEQPDQEPTFV